jgi:hypothetical protein
MLGILGYALSTLEKPLMNGVMEVILQFLDLRWGRYCILSILNLKINFKLNKFLSQLVYIIKVLFKLGPMAHATLV